MRTTVLAFVAGVTVTLVAVRFLPEFRGSDTEEVAQALRDTPSTDRSSEDLRRTGGRAEPALQSPDSENGQPTTERRAETDSRTLVDSGAQRDIDRIGSAQTGNTEAERSPRVASDQQESVERSDVISDVPVAPELMSAFLDPESEHYSPTSAENRRELESRRRDASWSAYMEAQIAAYLFGNEELSSHFSIPSIHCRPTICEVQAIGYGPGAYRAWVEGTAGAPDQPWFDFTGAGGPVRQQDGQTLILWYLANENK